MANRFYPCLLETFSWETWTWENLRDELSDELLRLVEEADSEGLLRFCNLPNTEPYRKAAIDVLDDLENASSTVSAITKEAQEIIETIANQ